MRTLSVEESNHVIGGDGEVAADDVCTWVSETAGAVATGVSAVAVSLTGPQNAMYVPIVSTLGGQYVELIASLQCELYSWAYDATLGFVDDI